MKLKQLLLTGAGALLLGSLAPAAIAGPALPSSLKPLATENSPIENVHYGRRCWRHYGHLHCRVVRRYYGGPYYSYGYGPGFGLYFGGHRHWGHRHWRRW
jgi:hypothetical protein